MTMHAEDVGRLILIKTPRSGTYKVAKQIYYYCLNIRLWHNAFVLNWSIKMTANVNQQLLENISLILKKSLSADATLANLRENDKASFKEIFTKAAGFNCTASTFQPYVEEVADEFLAWQKSQDQSLLIAIVKKIEQLFTVLGNFEHSHQK